MISRFAALSTALQLVHLAARVNRRYRHWQQRDHPLQRTSTRNRAARRFCAILGQPLPGDLGRPILERQHQLEAGGGALPDDPDAMPPAMTPEEQAAEAEQLRCSHHSF